ITALHLVLLRAHDRDAAHLDRQPFWHADLDATEERDDIYRALVADDLRVAEVDLRAPEQSDRVEMLLESPRPAHLLARHDADRPASGPLDGLGRLDRRRQPRRHRDEVRLCPRDEDLLDARGEVVE